MGLLAVLWVSLGAWEGALVAEPPPQLQQGVVVTATLRTAVRLTATVEGVRIQGGNLDLPETSVRVRLPQLILTQDMSAAALAGLTVIENISIEGSDVTGDAYLLPVELFGEWSGPKSHRATISFRLPSISWSALQKVLAVVGTQPSGADLRALAREADASGSMNISLSRRQTVPVFIGWFIPKEGLEGEPTPLQGECEVTLQVP
ncbi:MAG: hypothetical protein ABSA70_13365 [Terriglobia bacterium]